MKKISIILVVALVIAISPIAAFAHGHGDVSTQNINYSLCTSESCNITYVHKHNRTYYSGHSLNDGHEHHKVCTVQDCTKTATHKHDGNTYFGHHNEDGHNYHGRGSGNGSDGSGHGSRHSGGRHH